MKKLLIVSLAILLTAGCAIFTVKKSRPKEFASGLILTYTTMDAYGTVDRPYLIEVEYYNIKGEKIIEKFEGFIATVFSHEYDHLNGILHIDLADDVREMSYEEVKKYRSENPYQIISKDSDYKLIKKVE